MKIQKYILFILGMALFTNCETYTEPEIEYSPVFPLSGEYITTIYERDLVNDVDTFFNSNFSLRLYNTTANDNDSIWIKISSSAQPFGMLLKSGCNVPNLSFEKTNGWNYVTTAGFASSVTEGKLILKGASKKPSGTVPDSIRLVVNQKGRTFIIAGFRRTQWPQDELVW